MLFPETESFIRDGYFSFFSNRDAIAGHVAHSFMFKFFDTLTKQLEKAKSKELIELLSSGEKGNAHKCCSQKMNPSLGTKLLFSLDHLTITN